MKGVAMNNDIIKLLNLEQFNLQIKNISTYKQNNILFCEITLQKLKTKWHKDEIRKFLFSIDPDLKEAYFLKESYQEFNRIANYETFDKEFNELLDQFINSKFQEFREFGKILIHWKDEIKNSFIRYNGRRLSNGPIEGANSKIKTIFKSANGYKNFNRLRNRIIYSLNKDVPIKIN